MCAEIEPCVFYGCPNCGELSSYKVPSWYKARKPRHNTVKWKIQAGRSTPAPTLVTGGSWDGKAGEDRPQGSEEKAEE